MPGPMLDHVQIAAPPGCEPAARHFFGDLLGLDELPKPAPLSARGGLLGQPHRVPGGGRIGA
jgi:hypothetical protein